MNSLESTLEAPDVDVGLEKKVDYSEKSKSLSPMDNQFQIIAIVGFENNECIKTIWGDFYANKFDLKSLLSDESQFFVLEIYSALNVSGQSQIDCKILTLNGIERVKEKLENIPIEALGEFISLNERQLKEKHVFNKQFWRKMSQIELPRDYANKFAIGSIHFHKPMAKVVNGKRIEYPVGKVMVADHRENRYCNEIYPNVTVVNFQHDDWSGGDTYEFLLRPESDGNMNRQFGNDLSDGLSYLIERAVKCKRDAYTNMSCVDTASLSRVLTKESAFYADFDGIDQYDAFFDDYPPHILEPLFYDACAFLLKKTLIHFVNPTPIPRLHQSTFSQQKSQNVFCSPFVMDTVCIPLLLGSGLGTDAVAILANDREKIIISLKSKDAKLLIFWEEDLALTHSQGSKSSVAMAEKMVLHYSKPNKWLCIVQFEYSTNFHLNNQTSDSVIIVDE